MTESELCPPDPCVMKSNSVILFEITTDTNMTESELCPPDPCVKNSDSVFLFEISAYTNMTESELCPPDPCVTDLIKKSKLSRTGFSSNKLDN